MTENMDNIIGGFATTSVPELRPEPSPLASQAEYIPLSFKPPNFAEHQNYKSSPIPRYLFRAYSNTSPGSTSESWVESPAVLDHGRTSDKVQNILSILDEGVAANMLNKYLFGTKSSENEPADNFMSWTTSILVALFYIYPDDLDNLQKRDDVRLCIIDTTKFPEYTFASDFHLAEHYKDFDQIRRRLAYFQDTGYLDRKYLSQGALHVSGKCKVVDASTFIDGEFLEMPSSNATGMMQPLRWLRAALLKSTASTLSDERLRAIVRVADLFGSPWRLPVALSLVSVVRYLDVPERLLEGFKMFSTAITDEEWRECDPSKTNIVAHDELVEVEELKHNTEQLWQIFPCAKLQENVQQTVASLEASKERTLQLASIDQDRAAFWNAKTEAIRIMISLSKEIQTDL